MRLGAFRYFGTELWRQTRGDVVLTETAYEAGAALPSHSHGTAHDALVLSGAYVERAGESLFLRMPGDLVSYPRDVDHENRFGKHCAHILNLERRYPFPASERLQARSLVPSEAAAVARLQPRASTGPAWISAVRGRLDASPGISLGVLADEFGFHPVYLARRFRATFGCSVGQYALRARVRMAGKLMLETDMALAEVAVVAEYFDQSHMTGDFVRLTGFTPGGLRRMAG